MTTDAVKDVADDEAVTGARIVERFDAEMIACAEQLTSIRIPNTEREIAKQVFDACSAPPLVRAEHELDVRRGTERAAEFRAEDADDRRTVVETAVHDDDTTIVVSEGVPCVIVR